jgi:H/ACA ribonucleoprotein complex subunit 4
MGTLDPQVTGVLPVLLGRACRLSDYFMHKNKTYIGIMRVHKEVTDEKLKETIKQFIGKIKQLPPIRSSVKREIREREIISFEILEVEGRDVLFATEVQAGTYIRKLCSDIGEKIGGAHMLELRRTKAGMFDESQIYTLYDFDKAVEKYKKGDESVLREMIVPAEIISKIMPTVQIINKNLLKLLLTGKPLMKSDILKIPDAERFSVFDKEKLIGIYKKVDERNIVARAEFVFN